METSIKKYWLVWGENSTPQEWISFPSIKHQSWKLANNEATRLAIKHPNRKFFILEAMSYHETGIRIIILT